MWIRWAIHVGLTEEMRNAYKIILVIGKPKTSDPGDIGIDGRLILKWILKKRRKSVKRIQMAQYSVQRRTHVTQ